MDLKTLWRAFVKVVASLLCAGVFYSAWLATFLLVAKLDSPVVEAVEWLSAPVVTAAGFAVGIAVVERLAGASKTTFLRIFAWALAGCAIGAGVVYWFGPMLIVFGMFAVGAASMALREMVLIAKKAR